MRGHFVAGLGALVAALAAGACGDGPICPSDVFIAVQTTEIARDVDAAAPGVQADIVVKTSAAAGERVVLEVQDRDGVVVQELEATVDDRGEATFAAVTVTEPRTILRAAIETACGASSNAVTVDVFASSACQLALAPAPEPSAHYAPLGVLSTTSDPDPATPGYQIASTVTSRPGWIADLVQSTPAGDLVLGTAVADRSGVARIPQTLADGIAVLRAICREPTGTLAAGSLATTALVDTTRPTCAFTRPFAGSTITPRFDANGDLADGVQLALAAEVRGDDVEGEPTALVYQQTLGGAPVQATTTAVDASGAMTAVASLAPASTPASFTFGLVAQDHAGNRCVVEETFAVAYAACDLAMTTPAAVVTRDANASASDGSQVDVTLAVGAACAGRPLTAACGATTQTLVVPASGALTLRATVCGTVPCEADALCTFDVATADGVPTRTVARVAFDSQPPVVLVELAQPALPCGATISPASDVDPAQPGVQIAARVVATGGGVASRQLELSNPAGATTIAVGDAPQVVTLATGINRFVGTAYDAVGNLGRSAACTVRLAN